MRNLHTIAENGVKVNKCSDKKKSGFPLLLFGIAVLAFLLGGCAHKFPVIQPVRTSLETERANRAHDFFVQARDYERRGMDEMALRLYELAYEYDSESKFLRKVLLGRYTRSENYAKALILLKGDREISDLDNEEKRLLVSIYLKMGEMAKAAEVMELIEEKTEEEIYSLGLVYESTGQKQKAYRQFQKYFSDNPKSAGIGVKLVQFNIAEKRFAEAESLCTILQNSFPQNPEVLSVTGTLKYLTRDTAAALDLYEEALSIDSLNEEALRSMAHIHIVREQYPEAISIYRKLVAQEENGAVYRRGLAFLLFHDEEFEEAEKILNELVEEKPQDSELRYYRALVYSQTDSINQASLDFEKALESDSLNEDVWREYTYLYIKEKEPEKVIQIVDRYKDVFPESETAWRFRGYALNMQKKYEEAVVALKRAVRIDSTDYYAWFELGSALERKKNFEDAADAFRTVLSLRPGDAAASNYLGYMWAEQGVRLDSAKQLIENALEKEPSNGAYLDSYAWVLYQMGDYEEAHEYMKKALSQMDEDPTLFSHMGDILFELKQYSSAVEAYRKSLQLESPQAERIRNKLNEVENLLSEGKDAN